MIVVQIRLKNPAKTRWADRQVVREEVALTLEKWLLIDEPISVDILPENEAPWIAPDAPSR